jgi:3-dehydroquinate synthase
VLDALVEDLVRDPPGRLLLVVSDARVMPLHGRRLAERLSAKGLRVEDLTLAGGEQGKTREAKAQIEDRLVELQAGRDCALIAVGGGVVGDLAGFAAATWHRGVPVVQVPTSLLAMVDAALGGKTAVNLPRGKNLVGSFHQPLGVYADVSLLRTLTDRDYTDGFAEVVKTAAVADARWFRRIEGAVEALRARDAESLEQLVFRSMEIKARVVRRDERESGRRAMLNFGHTVAHALEAVSGYSMRHGPAVSLGLCVESRLAESVSGLPAAQRKRIERLLAALGLPVGLGPEPGSGGLVEAARLDKKNRDGRIRCALPVALGRMPPGDEVTVAVEERQLLEAIEASRAGPAD